MATHGQTQGPAAPPTQKNKYYSKNTHATPPRGYCSHYFLWSISLIAKRAPSTLKALSELLPQIFASAIRLVSISIEMRFWLIFPPQTLKFGCGCDWQLPAPDAQLWISTDVSAAPFWWPWSQKSSAGVLQQRATIRLSRHSILLIQQNIPMAIKSVREQLYAVFATCQTHQFGHPTPVFW